MLKVIIALVLVAGLTYAEELEEKPKACSWPYKYLGKDYNECTDVNGARPWCSTTRVYNGSWVYCKQDVGDLVTNDDFLRIIEEAKKVENKMIAMLNEKKNKGDSCTTCMAELKKVTQWIALQRNVFMDQNKRMQGLQKNLAKLLKLQVDLQSYRMRRNCRQTQRGGDYLGKVTQTKTGRTCQAWTSQKPHGHGMTMDNMYPDNQVIRAKNFCRNPDVSSNPWCYTTDSKKRFEECYIPRCNLDCKISESKETAKLPWCDAMPTKLVCSTGFKLFQSMCYKSESGVKATFAQADKNCNSLGGSLASVGNYDTSRFLATLFPKNSKNHYWIGLSDEAKHGSYKWTDGAKVAATYWNAGEPNNYQGKEHCIVLNWYSAMPWTWNDMVCNSKENYICEKKPQKI